MSKIKRREFMTAAAGSSLYLGAMGGTARAAKDIPPPPPATLEKFGINHHFRPRGPLRFPRVLPRGPALHPA